MKRRKLLGLSGAIGAGALASCVSTTSGPATTSREGRLANRLGITPTTTPRTPKPSAQRPLSERFKLSFSSSDDSKKQTRSRVTTRSSEKKESFFSRFGRDTAPKVSNSRGHRVAARARSWVGRSYYPGRKAQCASFVSTVLKPEAVSFRAAARAFDTDTIGPRVGYSGLKPGDIVLFQRTYNSPHRITHVGIYIGDGQFVHRSSSKGAAVISRIDSGRYHSKFYTARRLMA